MGQGADVMFTVTARSHILQSVRLSILLLNNLPQVLGAIMDLACLIYASITAQAFTKSPATSRTILAWFPVATKPLKGARGGSG